MYDSEGEDDDALLFSAQTSTSPSRSSSSTSSSSSSSSSSSGRPIITTSIVSAPRPHSGGASPASRQPDNKRPRTASAEEEAEGGYNSDEERRQSLAAYMNAGDAGVACTLPEDERAFEEDLRSARGFTIKRMIGDGNCLFRAVADQVFGDPDMHDEVRKRCMDYMERERDHYSQFITEDFSEYIRRKRRDKEFGNHVEIQAISEIYNRPVEVYAYGHRDPINIFHKHYFTEYAPIRLSYHHGNHYNSVIDPENPSVGVGLGLPQLSNPALEMERAIEQSIEETMYKDVLVASEWEATQKQIEEQVLLQSALEAGVGDFVADEAIVSSTTDREGDIFMGEDEDDQLAAALRQSELDYWESLSRGS